VSLAYATRLITLNEFLDAMTGAPNDEFGDAGLAGLPAAIQWHPTLVIMVMAIKDYTHPVFRHLKTTWA